MRYGSALVLAAAVAGFGLTTTLHAATITQDSTKNYVAFEAEANATISNPGTPLFGSTNDLAASGGAALLTTGARDDANKGTATYTIQFANAGTYLLYDLVRSDQSISPTDAFSANSFFIPTAFGGEPTTTAAYNGASNSATYIPFVETPTYTVTAGEVVTFKVGTREVGNYIDRFAFVDLTAPLWTATSTADEKLAAFNALPNASVPEPVSLALAAMAAGLLLRPRRRGV